MSFPDSVACRSETLLDNLLHVYMLSELHIDDLWLCQCAIVKTGN